MMVQSYPVNVSVHFKGRFGGEIGAARDAVVEDALADGCKYVWFVDDDTVPPSDAARKLIVALEQERVRNSNVKIIGGIYCTKTDPPEPLVFQGPGSGSDYNWKVGEVFPCWGLGTGCMMIDAEVFRALPKPWFVIKDEAHDFEGEDLSFCRKAQEAGFKVKAHGGVLCTHWDVNASPYKVYSVPPDSPPYDHLRSGVLC